MYKITCFCLCAIFLLGCNKQPENIQNDTDKLNILNLEKQKKETLLHDISGVWSDGNDLMTLYYDGSNIHLVIDEEAKEVTLGDIDTTNETVNLLVTKVYDGQQGIFTIKRLWNDTKTEYTLKFTSFDGVNAELGFVRKIGNDDKTRIENIYTNLNNKAYQYDEAEDLSSPVHEATSAQHYYNEQEYVEEENVAANEAHLAAEMAAAEAELDEIVRAAEEATDAAIEATNSY